MESTPQATFKGHDVRSHSLRSTLPIEKDSFFTTVLAKKRTLRGSVGRTPEISRRSPQIDTESVQARSGITTGKGWLAENTARTASTAATPVRDAGCAKISPPRKLERGTTADVSPAPLFASRRKRARATTTNKSPSSNISSSHWNPKLLSALFLGEGNIVSGKAVFCIPPRETFERVWVVTTVPRSSLFLVSLFQGFPEWERTALCAPPRAPNPRKPSPMTNWRVSSRLTAQCAASSQRREKGKVGSRRLFPLNVDDGWIPLAGCLG